MRKRVMVDMSVTLLHHGHIRLLKKAAALGDVVVALTIDAEVKRAKGYIPELSYDERREILESIRYVTEVVPCTWVIDEAFMAQHHCDLLVHGDDNINHIPPERLVIFPRTEGISSSLVRERVLDALAQLHLGKTPGSRSEGIASLLLKTIKKEFRTE